MVRPEKWHFSGSATERLPPNGDTESTRRVQNVQLLRLASAGVPTNLSCVGRFRISLTVNCMSQTEVDYLGRRGAAGHCYHFVVVGAQERQFFRFRRDGSMPHFRSGQCRGGLLRNADDGRRIERSRRGGRVRQGSRPRSIPSRKNIVPVSRRIPN